MVVISVMNGFEGQLKGTHPRGDPHVVVTNQAGRIEAEPEGLPDLAACPTWWPRPHARQRRHAAKPGQLTGVSVQGIDPARWPKDDILHAQMLGGRLDSLQAGEYHIVLGQGVASRLKVSIGDQVRLILTEGTRFTPLAGCRPASFHRLRHLRGRRRRGQPGGPDCPGDAQRMLRLPADKVGGIRLWLDDPFAADEVVKTALPDGLEWQDWRRERGELFQAVAMENG